MGADLGSDDEMISSINVTPLVDVMLVLLVIFMITAPVIYQSAIQVDLPKAATGEETDAPGVRFTLPREGGVYWNDEKIAWDEVAPRLEDLPPETRKQTVTITADEATPHGEVVRLMDILREHGLTRYALTVEQKS